MLADPSSACANGLLTCCFFVTGQRRMGSGAVRRCPVGPANAGRSRLSVLNTRRGPRQDARWDELLPAADPSLARLPPSVWPPPLGSPSSRPPARSRWRRCRRPGRSGRGEGQVRWGHGCGLPGRFGRVRLCPLAGADGDGPGVTPGFLPGLLCIYSPGGNVCGTADLNECTGRDRHQ